MKSGKRAGRVVKRVLADGTVKEYRYKAFRKRAPVLPSDNVGALIRAYTQSPEWRGLAEATRKNYLIYIRPFERVDHTPVGEFTRRDILTIRDGIADARGPAAANSFVSIAGAMFTWAVKHDWIAHSPVHKIDALKQGEFPAWTPAQADAALASLPEHLRRVVVLAMFTGQRRADLCAMRWSDYRDGVIALTQQKTKREMVIPVHPDLAAELSEWKASATAVTILTNARGMPWLPVQLSHGMRYAMDKLGFPPRLNVHGLRKLFAANLADAGSTTHEIAAGTGHKTLSMVQFYTEAYDQRKLATRAIGRLTTMTKRKSS